MVNNTLIFNHRLSLALSLVFQLRVPIRTYPRLFDFYNSIYVYIFIYLYPFFFIS